MGVKMIIRKLWRRHKQRPDSNWGLAIRNKIHKFTSTVHPYVVVVCPNFRSAHYFYIIFMAFLGSIFVYPVRNTPYIDMLFTMSGAVTQAGLNTKNFNDISLYQQLIIYIFTTLTTPIFIHGSLLFVRLYWFERHFDNIKESSKLNFKMRRNATLAARTKSFDSTRINTVNNQGLGQVPVQTKDPSQSSTSPQSSSTIHEKLENSPEQNGEYDNVVHVSEPSDDEIALTPALPQSDTVDPLQKIDEPLASSSADGAVEGIKFGNLPLPQKVKKEIDPSDMYMSITMLRNNRKDMEKTNGEGDNDDVLVIKSPKEIENATQNQAIFTRKPEISFTVDDQTPRRSKRTPKNRRRKQWSKLKKQFSNTPNQRKSRFHLGQDLPDEDQSIDSEGSSGANETDGDDDADDEYAHIDTEMDDEDDEELERAQSNLVIPSSDATGGKKFKKRANTFDYESKNIFKSPTFEKILKRPSRRLSRWRTPGLYSTTSGRSDFDTTDEEDDMFNNEHSLRKTMSTKYLSWTPTVGRNSTFVHLSEEQKEELGGVEYRAVKLLIKILLFYYIGFHVMSMLVFLIWIQFKPYYKSIIRADGISPSWWGVFTAQSAFNDLGYTLTPDSMSSFNKSLYVMIWMSFFIVIGNTGFPVFLRFLIWILFKCSKPLSLFKESLGFLLDHPRRCFTLLFPSIPTWWLFSILVILNAVDLILFVVLDLNNKYLLDIPTGYRVMDGLFQAFSTRTAGFAVVDLSKLHPAVQVSYMLMMYISVLPLAISIRRTNVYEEQSLGLYLKEQSNNEEDMEKSPKTFIGTHLRNQLSFDLWFIFLGLFIICIAEGGKLNQNNYRFSVFTVLFEIISAYGTVGLSLGYPGVDESFSYKFTTLSKLVIIAMMIRGRHRGLPYSLDRAIMLPDDDMQRRDKVQEHHATRRNTTIERANTNATDTGFGANIKRAISRRASYIPGFEERMRRSSHFSNSSNTIHPTNSGLHPTNSGLLRTNSGPLHKAQSAQPSNVQFETQPTTTNCVIIDPAEEEHELEVLREQTYNMHQ